MDFLGGVSWNKIYNLKKIKNTTLIVFVSHNNVVTLHQNSIGGS